MTTATRGYLPEAMANYLALLGWGAPDGGEIRPMSQIIEDFRLEHINKASAFFDTKKLDHFNGEYIRALGVEEFVSRSRPWLDSRGWGERGLEALRAIGPLVQERVQRLDEVPEHIGFLVSDEVEIDTRAWAKVVDKLEVAGVILEAAAKEFAECEWSSATLYELTKQIGERHGLKLGKASGPVRVATTGSDVGPPLFEALEFLGRERTVERLKAARARL